MSIRKRIFKNTLYTVTDCLAAAAAVCYPTEANDYVGIILLVVKEILQDCYTLFGGEELKVTIQKVTRQKKAIKQ